MSMDSWALIIATLIGVILTWVGSIVMSHFKSVKGDADDANLEVRDLQTDFLKYQVYASNEFAKREEVRRLETGIFAALTRLESKFDQMQQALYDKSK